jgi:hypothetical protein
MMKNLLSKLTAGIAGMSLVFVFALAPAVGATSHEPAPAANNVNSVCEGVGIAGGGTGCQDPTSGPTVNSVIKTVISFLSFIVGLVAVIMIIVGGFKYITSAGDAGRVTSAKNTILYAVVGLVVVVLAQVIVRFVLNNVK